MKSATFSDHELASEVFTVYVVEDDIIMNEAICLLARSVGVDAQGFLNVQDFLTCKRSAGPSCLVLDIRLRGSSGLALQDLLKSEHDPIPVIFVTGHADIPMSVRAMKAGAIDFLTKPFRDQDLLDAIAISLERDAARLTQERRDNDVHVRFEAMIEREREVMAAAAAGKLSKQIADELGISEVTVRVYRSSAMRKMRANSFAELVLLAHRLGIVVKDDRNRLN
ncbi:Nodulation protein W [Paraburkholderia unamae]|nr:response regulator [Paraburkholderia unamae]CAG9274605.1 Nodulation protein W [Paraburkholderia unamae]